MDSNNENSGVNFQGDNQKDSVKKDNPNDMKKYITKVDHRVKTKVSI